MINKLTPMKNYNSIDLMKFVMALCVVTIHTFFVENMEPSIIRDFLHSLICSAVPFFFMCLLSLR